MKRALAIAGSDPSGGAGIQRDLAVFGSLGVWGMSAITAITAQDTTGVHGIVATPDAMVVQQIEACALDIGIDAAKTGMIPARAMVHAIIDALARNGIDRLIVDPVLVATSGDRLTDEDTLDVVRDALLPRALVVTPNAREAQTLTGVAAGDRTSRIDAARALRSLGARNAIVTGGDDDATDVLVTEAGDVVMLEGVRDDGGPIHGTGCTFSAALTACIAKGSSVEQAARAAKDFTTQAIARARTLGRGARMLGGGEGEVRVDG